MFQGTVTRAHDGTEVGERYLNPMVPYLPSLARHGTRPPPRPCASLSTESRPLAPRLSAHYREQIQVQRTHTQASEAPSLLRSGAICVGSTAASTGAAAAEASPTVLACNRSSSRRCRPSFAARAWPLSAVALVDHLFDRRAEEGQLPVVVALDDARQQRRPTQRRSESLVLPLLPTSVE